MQQKCVTCFWTLLQEKLIPKVKNHLIELCELTLLEYETQCKVKKLSSLSRLFDISLKVVLFISKVEFHGDSKTSNLSTLL